MTKNKKLLETLQALLGTALFQTTLEAFAGERIAFPKNYACLDKNSRNRQIREEYENGADVGSIGKHYNLSDSQVYKIIERLP